MLAAVAPDDAQHSPVSGKWELYVIGVTEVSAPALVGDVNGDGKRNISDVTFLINLLLTGTASGWPAADVNGDTIMNISDVTNLVNMLLTQGAN